LIDATQQLQNMGISKFHRLEVAFEQHNVHRIWN
jgi:hypothetical protein